MCNICGKVMRSDHLKRHFKTVHDNECQEKREEETVQCSSSLEQCTNEQQQANKKASILLEFGNVDAKLVFELQRDRDVYVKNVDIGRQVAIVLSKGDIPEESLALDPPQKP